MILIQRMGDHALPLPARQTGGAGGYDLSSGSFVAKAQAAHMIYPGDRLLIPTGFAWKVPMGFVGLVRPRSGLANKEGLDVMAGVIDSDYTGEVKVLLVNHGDKPVTIEFGDRIAQLVVVPCMQVGLIEVDTLGTTDRGINGFGSTGAAA